MNKKIVILGAAHSGTSLLYKMMAFHPELAWFCQFSQRNGRIPGRFGLPFLNCYKRNIQRLIPHKWEKVREKPWIPRPAEGDGIWNYIMGIEDETQRLKESGKIVASELLTWRKPHILFKKPGLRLHLDFLNRAFPGELYFIHIVRDGRAVVLSDLHKFRGDDTEMDALKRSNQYWKEYLLKVTDFFKKTDKTLEIKYEDFITDIHTHIQRIFDFCGLTSSLYPYNKIPINLNTTNNKWIHEKNREKLDFIEKESSELLERYHYI
jgi:hypothetical protein